MKGLVFGTAGIPLATPERNTLNGISYLKKIGLGAMEIEFVRQVNIPKEKTSGIKKASQQNEILLTCHGQYFINLNSLEKEKREASIQRVLNAARIADLCGAFSLTFHSAYYMDLPADNVYLKVRESLKSITKKLKDEGHSIRISPETTGKGTQFGTVSELIRLAQEVEQVGICVDFSHLYSRSVGSFNTEADFKEALTEIEKGLGREALSSMHIHLSGMHYGPKGERNHLNMKDEDNHFTYKAVLQALKEFNAAGVVISESPNIEEDSLLMQKTYARLSR
ncbi:MAG TPA: TIM barrel protein [Candidatus Nanoarchaeia archaeon]|nr:TIM barrel protein [Candidatus Nanoarchaeia archaeon]